MIVQHTKNTAFELVLPLLSTDAPESFLTGVADQIVIQAYSKDGTGIWQPFSLADTFSEIGTTGVYEISLLAAELNHDWVFIRVSATGATDTLADFRMTAAVSEEDEDEVEPPVEVTTGRNTQLTLANLKDRIQRRLGSGLIRVELTSAHLQECVQSTLEEYNHYRPFRGYAALALTTTATRYGPIESLHSGFLGVLSVAFLTPLGVRGESPWNISGPELEEPQFRTAGNELMAGEMLQHAQHSEAEMTFTSTEPEWRGVWDSDGHYYLYIDPGGLDECSYAYSARYAMAVNISNGMHMIPHGDVKWFLDYATAQAKIILSEVRGKFEEITGPEGGQPIDWSRHREEAETMMEKLIEDIKTRQRPLPPVIG